MPPYLSKRQKIGLVLALTMNTKSKNNKHKRVWSKQQMLDKQQMNHMKLIKELDNENYRDCLHMNNACFEELLLLVGPLITKHDTFMRQAVSAEDRLVVTLKYLSLGKDYGDLASSCGISAQSLSKIIPETCESIYQVLKGQLKMPATENDWLEVAKQYQKMWQFNNCVGTVDGRHILVMKPRDSGSLYHNYNGSFSVVLFAVVKADYEFLYVHTGTEGSLSDGPSLKHTGIYQKLIEGELNLPQPSLLLGTKSLAPYVFIGDHGFGLDTNILVPYREQDLSHEKRVFNYRLKRAKKVSENVFGILASRFRVFQKNILPNIQHVDKIVLATCVLHNYLKRNSDNYITRTCIDYEDIENETLPQGQWRQHRALLPLQKENCQNTEKDDKVKKMFRVYFNGRGSVDFQERMLYVYDNCE